MIVVADRSHLLVNALLFQTTWFGCVMGGAAGRPVWGYVALGALFALVVLRAGVRADLRLVFLLGVLGFCLDSLWIALGVLDFGGREFAPGWVVALWLGLALTVNHSLAWLKGRPALAATLAAAAAPLTYLAGERLGAVNVPEANALVLVSLTWATLFWLMFRRAPAPAAVGAAPVGGDPLERRSP